MNRDDNWLERIVLWATFGVWLLTVAVVAVVISVIAWKCMT